MDSARQQEGKMYKGVDETDNMRKMIGLRSVDVSTVNATIREEYI